jgi:hypothetical protein
MFSVILRPKNIGNHENAQIEHHTRKQFHAHLFPVCYRCESAYTIGRAIQFLYDSYNYEEDCSLQSPAVKVQLTYSSSKLLFPVCEEDNQDSIYWIFVAYDKGLGVIC